MGSGTACEDRILKGPSGKALRRPVLRRETGFTYLRARKQLPTACLEFPTRAAQARIQKANHFWNVCCRETG